jgi:hypothetical protein
MIRTLWIYLLASISIFDFAMLMGFYILYMGFYIKSVYFMMVSVFYGSMVSPKYNGKGYPTILNEF